eukprot:394631_1
MEGNTKGDETVGDECEEYEYEMGQGVTTPKGVRMMDLDAYRDIAPKNADTHLLEVQQWFQNVLELPLYFDAFVSNGYETMQIIKEISSKQELTEIGVSSEHQMIILQQIETWKYENIVVENNKSEGDYWDDRAEKEVNVTQDNTQVVLKISELTSPIKDRGDAP